jgi:beta-glucosidase
MSKLNSVVVVFACLMLCAVPFAGRAQAPGEGPPAEAGDTVARQRVDELLKQMTPEEKIGQLSQLFMFAPSKEIDARVAAGEVGSILFVTDPAEINRVQKLAVEGTRLHIPLLFGLDVIHGFRNIFPSPIAMAASWDPAMVETAQSIAAKEARASGIHWTFAPMVDIARDPRWGRIVEGAGEDPYLGSAIAAAQVRGFQGATLGAPEHIVATAKHFAGYGAAEGGRDYEASEVSESQLMNIYLPPFHSAVNAGVGTVMSAYMDLNGVPATGNRWLLHDVLRDQWHFNGFVVSDADAVRSLKTHGFAADLNDAALRAFAAGVNMEMALEATAYSAALPRALKAGRITVAQIDEMVRPILETKVRLGLFDHPYIDEAKAKEIVTSRADREETRRAAERSAVLLRNEGSLLPLKAGAPKTVAVIGPLGDSNHDITGSWTFANKEDESVSILQGLQARVPDTKFVFAPGVQINRKFPSPISIFSKPFTPWPEEQANSEFTKAVDLAKGSDLVIMVLGEKEDMSGEAASRSSLDLPGKEQQLLEAVVATGKPVVLVLLNGRPLNITWAAAHVPAILEAWYPGTEGGNAVANLLYGKAVPAGKLPFSWPRNVGQVPIFYSHNTTQAPEAQATRYWEEASTPLFPFGYGLSYTHFEYSNLQAKTPQVKKGQSVVVSIDVQNTGDVSGDEIAQLYIHQPYGTSSRPVRELKGFRRVSLAPHEKKTLEFTLTDADLTYWSSATRGWVQDAAPFDVWVGADSTAALKAGFTVTE